MGTEYHLISENEWLTIAENVLDVPENDINSETEGLQLATSSPENTDNNTDNIAYSLTNQNKIYGIAGNISEWTDKIIGQDDLFETGSDNWEEYYKITSYKSLAEVIPPYYLDSSNGIGKFFTGQPANADNPDRVLRAFVRGFEGIYSLDLSNAPTTATSTIGFRCAK